MDKPLTIPEARERLKAVPGWQLQEAGPMLWREYKLKNFMAAVDFINRIATIAEELDHHPDLHLTGYRNLRVELFTHSLKGLSEKDFQEALRINGLA